MTDQLASQTNETDHDPEIWKSLTDGLRKRVNGELYDRWFSGVRFGGADGSRVTLEVSNNIYQLWIEENFMDLLQCACLETFGGPRRFEFRVREEIASGEANGFAPPVSAPTLDELFPSAQACPAVENGARLPASAPIDGAADDDSAEVRFERSVKAAGLNPNFSFDSFVVGGNSEFAHAAAVAVAKRPGRTYNPLFIYGGSGLGKTHLMQAIGQEILRRRRKSKVVYLSCEQFTNDFIAALKNGQITEFRKRLRQADVLLIDDVQFLRDKESTQEEFFHTFNALFDHHKQIVMTSDRPPSEIATLEERLVSRFEWGLNANLQPPSVETRIAILRKKMEQWGVAVPMRHIEFLATRIRNNVRRLEGGLMRLACYLSIQSERRPDDELPVAQVEELLRDILRDEARNAVTTPKIQKIVADYFDFRVSDLTGPRRPA
ncbi:MAG: chromosomal replication initiator protein DnaA [Verrucomicrobiales bacterium]